MQWRCPIPNLCVQEEIFNFTLIVEKGMGEVQAKGKVLTEVCLVAHRYIVGGCRWRGKDKNICIVNHIIVELITILCIYIKSIRIIRVRTNKLERIGTKL